MKQSHAITFALASFASAQESYGPGPGATPFLSPQFFAEYGRTPNATRSIPFDAIYNQGRDDPANKWAWQINITEIPLDENEGGLGAKRTNTIYSFQWPLIGDNAGATITEELDDLVEYINDGYNATNPRFDGSACVSVVNSYFPLNVTNAWNAGSVNNSCDGVLSSECRNAIARELADGDVREDGCSPSTIDLSTIGDCAGTFSPNTTFSTYSLINDDDGTSLDNNTAYAHYTTASYDDVNSPTSPYDAQRLRLHMNIVQTDSSYTYLCARVDDDEPARANVGAGEDASPIEEGAASSTTKAGSLLIAFALAAAVGVMW